MTLSVFPHTSAEYQEFYKERKRLLSHYPEAEIAPFVNENRVNVSESVYKLTDNTMVEKAGNNHLGCQQWDT